ncbi:MAG: RNA polymerase sigma factor RpoD/SigA [Candidatus Cloacimonetes bacterium]|nr:RNA polymerase sigma factor RpoD/SigA [Candidatus Cloacimonadota bacterium]
MSENIYEDEGLQKYLKEISDTPTLTREEEQKLAKRAKKGDQEAIQKLIESNLKFVVSIAARYQNRGLSYAELISEGNMGLIKAIEKFDPDRDIKLISYAVWWIKQRIMFALAEKTNIIRVPLGKSNALSKLKSAQHKFKNETGEEPTLDELALETKLKKKNIKKLRDKNVDTLSLDDVTVTGRNDQVQLIDLISDTTTLDPQSRYYRDKTEKKIKDSIAGLDSRSALVIQLYFGLGGEERKNFAEIAEILGLSRERIRQIHKEALKKILKDIQSESENHIDYIVAHSL